MRINLKKTMSFGDTDHLMKRDNYNVKSKDKKTKKKKKTNQHLTKHCPRHNGPKALSTLTHSTPLIQSRSFNKL